MDLTWRKSTRSSGNGGNCVEVAHVLTSRGAHKATKPTKRTSRNYPSMLIMAEADIFDARHASPHTR
jgi:hypothetical protein